MASPKSFENVIAVLFEHQQKSTSLQYKIEVQYCMGDELGRSIRLVFDRWINEWQSIEFDDSIIEHRSIIDVCRSVLCDQETMGEDSHPSIEVFIEPAIRDDYVEIRFRKRVTKKPHILV